MLPIMRCTRANVLPASGPSDLFIHYRVQWYTFRKVVQNPHNMLVFWWQHCSEVMVTAWHFLMSYSSLLQHWICHPLSYPVSVDPILIWLKLLSSSSSVRRCVVSGMGCCLSSVTFTGSWGDGSGCGPALITCLGIQ